MSPQLRFSATISALTMALFALTMSTGSTDRPLGYAAAPADRAGADTIVLLD